MATTFSTGTQSPTSHKPLEKIFEEAQSTGAVCLCGRKLREYPKISSRYDLIDTISAGECPCPVSLSNIHNSIMNFRQKFSVYVCQFCSLINLKQQLTRNYNNKVQTTSTIVFWRRIILDDGDSLTIELEMTVIFVSNTTNKKASSVLNDTINRSNKLHLLWSWVIERVLVWNIAANFISNILTKLARGII